ncbi:MAG: hypothetical protein WDN72_07835 [Alphaproteobacteria bacterium]
MRDDEIDTLLRARSVPAPRVGFEARILAAAFAAPVRAASVRLRSFFAPAPSFALALSLLVGVLIGVHGERSAPQSALQIYLDDEGTIL